MKYENMEIESIEINFSYKDFFKHYCKIITNRELVIFHK